MVPILLHLPHSLKSLAPVLEQILDLTQQAVDHAHSDLPLHFPAWEQLCSAMGAAVEMALTGAVLQGCARDDRRLCIGGRVCRPVVVSTATFYSMRGPVEVARTLYRALDDRCGPAFDPVALRCGCVRKTWLPATAAAMAFLLQQQPAREVVEALSTTGVLPYGRSSFEAVSSDVGELYQQHAEDVETELVRQWKLPEGATGVVLSLDRVAMPFEEPRPRGRGRPRKKAPKRSVQRVWHMAYCATVSVHDAHGKTLKTLRYGCMPSEHIEGVVEGMRDDVRALLVQRPGLHVLVLCDGGAEMWTLLSEVKESELECAIERLVDLWHLLEKLGKALRMRHDEQRARAELQRWKMRLLNVPGTWEKLRAELSSWGLSKGPGQDCPVHEALTFVSNQGEAGRLNYARARSQGQPVGSGVVEATCKSLVNVRFKRGGARWKQERAGRLIRLRALALSERWDNAMELLLPRLRGEVRRVA